MWDGELGGDTLLRFRQVHFHTMTISITYSQAIRAMRIPLLRRLPVPTDRHRKVPLHAFAMFITLPKGIFAAGIAFRRLCATIGPPPPG